MRSTRRARLANGLLLLTVCLPTVGLAQQVHKTGEVRTDNLPKLPLVWCGPGSFQREWVGKHPKQKGLGPFREPVKLTKGFWIGQYEVTQGEWLAVMGNRIWDLNNAKKPEQDRDRGKYPEGPRYPVTLVSWEDATEFCQRLTSIEREAGRLPADEVYRLPTEAEWEWACRAGSSEGVYCCGDSVDELRKYAWFSPSKRGLVGELHEIGLKLPNRWGLYDMHGNAEELCLDEVLEWSAFGTDPVCRSGKNVRFYKLHVTKGGHYASIPVGCEFTFHGDTGTARPRGELAWIGFRVARGHAIEIQAPPANTAEQTNYETGEKLFKAFAAAIDEKDDAKVSSLMMPMKTLARLKFSAKDSQAIFRLQAESIKRLPAFRRALSKDGLLPLAEAKVVVSKIGERIVNEQTIEVAKILVAKTVDERPRQIIGTIIKVDGAWSIVELFDEEMIKHLDQEK